ncbi:DUF5808 domain-containing protein [Flavobacterium gilvum]|uniref:DUF5808 domain-containing protein n=1 Tax=Flavobacterium gilvum TaxID=1492737 RepID=A0AAC9I1B2_9FLAO|nr:DUF5808 domain-containing protein [Flavobacterium gilvum]AOW08104.1 hypothetical protein EM308_00490 [Flavobacterium gilvum]KFC58871.1 hypothetical protein FEM08_23590 [Flavobacterium gilvum]
MSVEKPTQEEYNNWHKDPDNWKWCGLIYYNKADDRIFVPKKAEWMGITINFANKNAKWAIILVILFFSLVLLSVLRRS